MPNPRRGVMVNGIGLINEVNQRRARLVLGWVNRLCTQLTNSTRPSSGVGKMRISFGCKGKGAVHIVGVNVQAYL